MVVRRTVLLLVVAAVLAACTRGTDEQPPSPEPTVPPSTVTLPAESTTTTVAGFEVPAVVDVPYVQRVVDEIYRLEGEAARYIYARKLPDAEFNARIEAIFGEPALEETKKLYGRGAASGFDTFADPPGNPKVKVRSVVQATPSCILVRADLDFRPLFIGAERTEPNGVVLLSVAEVLPFNLTGWGVVAAGTIPPGEELKRC